MEIRECELGKTQYFFLFNFWEVLQSLAMLKMHVIKIGLKYCVLCKMFVIKDQSELQDVQKLVF